MRNIAAISGVAVAVVLVGCAAGSGIRTDRVVISEDDSKLVFSDPKTADLVPTFFRQAASDDYGGDPQTTFVGLWRSRSGTFPHARINYIKAGLGYHFEDAFDISTYVEKLRFGEKGQVEALEKGKQRNLLGPVDYQKFSVGPIQCVAFAQTWDSLVDVMGLSAGTKRIVGYYCGSQGESLSDQRIAEIVSAVGVKGDEVPEPPAGWKAVKAGKSIEGAIELPLKARWEGIQEDLSGKFLTASMMCGGRIWFALPSKSSECTGEWSHESGTYETPDLPTGTWSLLCTNGMSASGTYISTEPGIGTGGGKDRDGNVVNFSFGSPKAPIPKLAESPEAPVQSAKDLVGTRNRHKLEGEWTGVSKGKKETIIFQKDGTVNFIVGGKSIADKVKGKGTLHYLIDPSKVPMELNLIVLDIYCNELGRVKMIVQFLADDKIKVKTLFGDKRPGKLFTEGDQKAMIFSKVK